MIIILSNNRYMFKTVLPDKIEGRYWICDRLRDGKRRNLICVEAVEGKWIAKSNSTVRFYDGDNHIMDTVAIYSDSVYMLRTFEGEKLLLYANSYADSGKLFKKVMVPNGVEITVGRNESNTICYTNKFVSGTHLSLKRMNLSWTIKDMNSTNGTYVNNAKVNVKTLSAGDVITIMGLRIIMGSDFISINNPNQQVTFDEHILSEYELDEYFVAEDSEAEEPEEELFFRSPRLMRRIEALELKVAAPPAPQDVDRVPMAMMIGPSLTMGMGSASTGIFSVINAVGKNAAITTIIPTLTMSMAMLCGTILWPIITKKYEKRSKKILENKRQSKYRAYLVSVRDRIVKEAGTQAEILKENNVSLTECENIIMLPKQNLWERSIGQEDFLDVRVGMGNIPMAAELDFPERGFTLEEDNLADDLQALASEPKILKNVPITYSFLENTITGIFGEDYEILMNFIKGIIVRIAASHSYNELKFIVFVDKDREEDWEFIKWFPHIWDDRHEMRFFAADEGDAKEVFSAIDKILEEDAEENNKKDINCWKLIIDAGMGLLKRSDTIGRVYSAGSKAGFSVIHVCGHLSDLPKECTDIIEISKDSASKIYDKNDITGACYSFDADKGLLYDAEEVGKRLSNIKLDLSSQTDALPGMLTFLEMYNVGKIEHLNILTRWKENDPTVSMKAPIGIDAHLNHFFLDLHEKFQGPHGLVAGMTGSGKSEFIITYILSMAVNYHPDEVAFILIDYKGGGLAGAFEDKERGIKLPHLAGTITNLDGAAVKRSLISIQSELRRRQAVFNEARRASNEGTIDIYKYQKLYREGTVKEPIPHLFIISDEFAELKSQQPEFMAQLISAARIGRSLGVHLILATQKPSGVVDDQIWSNSRFRVCLKVQEKADSMDMIKRPDAAELSATGRFYLQVGFNEFFDMGQSAWCGAEYVPSDSAVRKERKKIRIIDNLGRTVREVKEADKDEDAKKSGVKQIVGIVNYLSKLAREEKISVRQLWLDEIPDVIMYDELIDKYGYKKKSAYKIETVVGELDDPFNQSQELLTIPISEGGNTIVYGNASSGKELFLSTIIYGLIQNYEPEYLNIYVMDFGSETLKVFEQAPQVGGVLLSSEKERVERLMKLLREALMVRKKLLADYGGSYDIYYETSNIPISNILVIINNFAAVNELYEEAVDDLAYLCREGSKYGINFIFTATTYNEIRYKVSQNCAQTYLLQMNDNSDYLGIVGSTEGVYPSKYYGRGIIKKNHTYEFQTAHICADSDLQGFVREECKRLEVKYGGKQAPGIKTVPEQVESDMLAEYISDITKVPVGIDMENVEPAMMDFNANIITPVLSANEELLASVSDGLIGVMERIADTVFKVLDSNVSEEEFRGIYYEIVERHKSYKVSQDNSGFVSKLYLINGVYDFVNGLSEDGRDKFAVMLENCRPEFKVRFICCDEITKSKKYTSERWYRERTNPSVGIWLGSGIDEQYTIKHSLERKTVKAMPKDSAVLVKNNRYRIIRPVAVKREELEL